MKILMRIFMIIFLLIGGLLIFATTRPDTFHVERSIDINAPARKIFPFINDLRKGGEWSPWEKSDPHMQRTYIGPSSGKGAGYVWAGNEESGKGKMTITESLENQKVVVALHFDEPMQGDSVVEYVLSAKGEQTNVKWTMSGPMAYISKVICIFMDMDKMIGGQFEKGLQNLKTVVEK
jgi:hypothetical protein